MVGSNENANSSVPTGEVTPSRIVHSDGSEERISDDFLHGSSSEIESQSHAELVESYANGSCTYEEASRVMTPVPPLNGFARPLGAPMRLIFGEMAGVVFLAWIPVLLAFFLPWPSWQHDVRLAGGFNAAHLAVALIISLPPWIVLTIHLSKGRLWDGILDMFLWVIWECIIVITLCYLYPTRAQQVFWNASDYWSQMRSWLDTGAGREGNPALWLPLHAKHLVLLVIGSLFFGLPALMMGVLQLNYMNYYVAQCMLLSDNALLTLVVAWHFWSVVRVAGYIVLASTVFQMVMKSLFGSPARAASLATGLVVGLGLVVIDGLLKWQLAEGARLVLAKLCGL